MPNDGQDRYQRQSLVPQMGREGQQRMAAARVAIFGMGALGATIADQLGRAGVALMRIVDRDVVEWTNLQRQTLYEETDARRGLPKVEAAARRLSAIRSDLVLEPHAVDVDSANIESLARNVDLLLDGSDNAELRYLINDVSVKHGIPWVMGGCIGVEGRVAAFASPKTDAMRAGPSLVRTTEHDGGGDAPPLKAGGACLRCVFPNPPGAGELATCDTAGVLAPAIGVVASMQVVEAMKLLIGDPTAATRFHTIDVWSGRHHALDISTAKRVDCVCCGERRFEFLDRPATGGAKLCGRNAVQVRPTAATRIDLAALAARIAPVADIDSTPLMLTCALKGQTEVWMNVFGDGRAIVFGTTDLATARSLYARIVGT